MMRVIGVWIALLLVACQPVSWGSSVPTLPSPSPTTQWVASPETVLDPFEGTWLLGTDAEPPKGVVRGCTSKERFFVTLENGGDLLVFKRPRRCGALPRETAFAMLNGNQLVIKGARDPLAPDAALVDYDLTYNSETQHFTGTRAGVRVWLARQEGFCDEWVRAPCVTSMSGRVEDAEGRSIPQAEVRVRSMNPSYPFDSHVEASRGTYRLTDVPAGVEVEVTVTASGHVLRQRLVTLTYIDESATLPFNVVDFVDLIPPP